MTSIQPSPSKGRTTSILDEEEETTTKTEAPSNSEDLDKEALSALLYSEAQKEAEKQGGYCLPPEGPLKGKFLFKCRLGHQWKASVEDMKKKWCKKCAKMLDKCRKFADSNGGMCINEHYEKTIIYKCDVGHIWKVKYKSYKSKWCPQCVQDEKELNKKKARKIREDREKVKEKYQKQLFDEAQLKSMSGYTFSSEKVHFKETIIEIFQRTNDEVELLADEEAIKFREKEGTSVSRKQAKLVYKMLLFPEDILSKFMMSQTEEVFKAEFKKLFKSVHPDKNKHPGAGEAFKRIRKIHDDILSKKS